jgi:hypothetical protein
MENTGIIYCHLEYFTVIWNILWPFGNVVVMWYIFHCFGTLCQEKSGNPEQECHFNQGMNVRFIYESVGTSYIQGSSFVTASNVTEE